MIFVQGRKNGDWAAAGSMLVQVASSNTAVAVWRRMRGLGSIGWIHSIQAKRMRMPQPNSAIQQDAGQKVVLCSRSKRAVQVPTPSMKDGCLQSGQAADQALFFALLGILRRSLAVLMLLLPLLWGLLVEGPAAWAANAWQQTSGPGGGTVYAFAIDPLTPATVYAGTSGAGVFKSSDGGTNWSPVNSGLTYSTVLSLAINPTTPSTLYAGTLDGGVFKSIDDGANWSPVNIGLPNTSVRSLVIDPVTPDTLYAAAAGVFKSTDGGASWSAVNSGLTHLLVSSVVMDPTTPSTLYATTELGGGVFKSTDGGANWSAANSGLTNSFVQSLAIDPSTPTTLYAGTSNGVFKSTDGSASWSVVNSGLASTDVRSLVVDPMTHTTLHAGTAGGGVFKSTDGGASWTTASTGLTHRFVQALVIDPTTPSRQYAGTSIGGVFKSTDGGANWYSTNSGLTNNSVYSLVMDRMAPTTLYAGTGSGGVFKSTDGGAHWSVVNSGLASSSVHSLAMDPTTPTTLYAGTGSGGVFKSTDGGASWLAANSGLTNNYVQSLAIDLTTPTTLYAGGGGGVFKSNNGGGNWSAVSIGLTNTDIRSLAIDPMTPTTLYAGTTGGVFKSTDGGANWTVASGGITGSNVLSLAINPTTPTTLYAGTGSGGVFQSTDGGISWLAVNNGLTTSNVYSVTINPTTPATLYAGTTAGVFKSTDGGASWSAASSGLTTSNVTSLVIDPTTPSMLYAGTSSRSVFKSTNGALTSNTRLLDLVLQTGAGSISLTPTFASGTTSYSATAPAASVTLTPTASAGDAMITINGMPISNGVASAGLPLNLGITTLSVLVTSGDGSSTQTYTVVVTRPAQAQAITFNPLVAQNFGATVPALSATATSGQSVTFASTTPLVCSVSGTTLTLLAVGTCTIEATQLGNAAWLAATPVQQSFAVNPVVPGAPTGVQATAGNAQATVSWTAPSFVGSSALIGYRAEVVGDSARFCAPAAPATGTTCTINGLVNGTAYTFHVFATNGVGNSAASAASTIVTPQAPATGGGGGGGSTPPTGGAITVPTNGSATLVGAGSATLGTGATLTVQPQAAGSPITPPASGTASVVLGTAGGSVTLGQPAGTTNGQAVVLAPAPGQGSPVLGLLGGSVVVGASAPGQVLLDIGPTGTSGVASGQQVVAGPNGARIEARRDANGSTTVQVLEGGAVVPCGAPCPAATNGAPASTITLLQGEVATIDAQGRVLQVSVGTPLLQPQPAPLGIALPAALPSLTGAPPARTPGHTLLEQAREGLQVLLGQSLVSQGQQSLGNAIWTLEGGLTLGLLPLGPPFVDLTLPNGASLLPDGTLRVVHQGLVQRFGPAPLNLQATGEALRAVLPQAQLRIADTGTWWVESAGGTGGGAPLVLRPGWLALQGAVLQPPMPRFETDATGQLWLAQANGLRTPLYPALAEPAALQTLLSAADAQAMMQMQVDGSVLVRLAGQKYHLQPLPSLQPIPALRAGQALWLEVSQSQLLLWVSVGEGRWAQAIVVSLMP